jgi:hypothetical protein
MLLLPEGHMGNAGNLKKAMYFRKSEVTRWINTNTPRFAQFQVMQFQNHGILKSKKKNK